jgi:hypothetical protein
VCKVVEIDFSFDSYSQQRRWQTDGTWRNETRGLPTFVHMLQPDGLRICPKQEYACITVAPWSDPKTPYTSVSIFIAAAIKSLGDKLSRKGESKELETTMRSVGTMLLESL